MSGRLRTFFELIRLPNLFTAPPDVIAGACIGGAIQGDFGFSRTLEIGLLGLASMHLYAGGVALNDAADHRLDAGDRPDRPIPSGRIDRAVALRLACLLLAAGGIVAFAVSTRAGGVSLCLIAAVAGYNVLKTRWFAPLLMGACRGLNMGLGLALSAGEASFVRAWPAVCLAVYVAGLTVFARRETRRGFRASRVIGLTLMYSALYGALQIWIQAKSGGAGAPLAWLALAALIGAAAWRALRDDPADVQKAVVVFILGIVLLDAWLAGMHAGASAGAMVLVFSVPFLALARGFRPT